MPRIPGHSLGVPHQQPAVCAVFDKHIHVLVSDVSPECIYIPQKCTFLLKSQPLGLVVEGNVSQQLNITLGMLEVVSGLAWNSYEQGKLPFLALKKKYTYKTSKLSFILSFRSQPSLSVATSVAPRRLGSSAGRRCGSPDGAGRVGAVEVLACICGGQARLGVLQSFRWTLAGKMNSAEVPVHHEEAEPAGCQVAGSMCVFHQRLLRTTVDLKSPSFQSGSG